MSTRSAFAVTLRGLQNLTIAELAAEQRGCVARSQLLERGWSDTTVDRRIAERLLTPVWPATYAYGNADLTRDGWLFAATLACGEGTHLVARASAAARGLLSHWSTVDVRPANRRGVDLPGLRPHFMDLRAAELDVHRGLPVTTLARTALDVAATEPADRVGELLDRALLEGQYDHREMVELLDVRRGCRGVRILRGAVDALGDDGQVFRSRPERLARGLLREAGLPEPRTNAWFPTRGGHGYELDLWYPALRFDLEIDGPHHRLPHQRRKDERRDADLRTFGVEVLRVPDTLVLEAPEAFVHAVGNALRAREIRIGPTRWG
jgi:hypothetical protein